MGIFFRLIKNSTKNAQRQLNFRIMRAMNEHIARSRQKKGFLAKLFLKFRKTPYTFYLSPVDELWQNKTLSLNVNYCLFICFQKIRLCDVY